jgi:hypothetical protein
VVARGLTPINVSVRGDGGAPPVVARVRWIDGFHDLDAVFTALARSRLSAPRAIDLHAHSSRAHGCLLRFEDRILDGEDRDVLALFERHGPALRRHASAIRVLGCRTAATRRARATLRRLADASGVPVLGTIEPICDTYFDRSGFSAAYANRLVDGAWAPPPVGSWSE